MCMKEKYTTTMKFQFPILVLYKAKKKKQLQMSVRTLEILMMKTVALLREGIKVKDYPIGEALQKKVKEEDFILRLLYKPHT